MTSFQDNIRVSSDIFNFLLKSSSGEVLLTTSKGVYLQFSSRILLLTDSAYGLTPTGLGIDRFVDFVTLISPQPGQKVFFRDSGLHFAGGTLSGTWDVVNPQHIHHTIVPEQIIKSAELLTSQCGERSLAHLAAPLLLNRELCKVAQNNPLCIKALPLLQSLILTIQKSDTHNINSLVQQLLGLGHGLTPSMDDILLGILYCLLRQAPQEPCTNVLAEACIRHAPSYTNAISGSYLNAVAQGAHFERLDDILVQLGSANPIDIAPILEIGSSSGTEMLLGLLLAAKIITKG